ncbi:hypothetical protein DIJ64_00880 [Mycobacterium leprae]|uniref:Uncharacterized protein n=1 Tax=Mycobacterium leprae TaxID=1769 RepID=A0AAD0KR60_MYCLR|nr:hypothetical protein DIJ64_00880 [Mycobacterium leprae]
MAADYVDATVALLVTPIGRNSPQGLAASKILTTAVVIEEFNQDAERLTIDSGPDFVSGETR